MRHFLPAPPIKPLSRRMRKSPRTTGLIPHPGRPQRRHPSRARALLAAVALATVTSPTNHPLKPAAGTVEHPGRSIHRQVPLPTYWTRPLDRAILIADVPSGALGAASGKTWRFEPMPCRFTDRPRLSTPMRAPCQPANRINPFPSSKRSAQATGPVESDQG